MNRLQKKCLIAAAGTHFLLLVGLLCSGFVRPSPKPTTPVLDFIPAKAIDALLNSGKQEAPPPPAPVTPPTPVPPTPEPAKPVVTHVEPPQPVEPVKPTEPIDQDNPIPTPKSTKPRPHEVEVNLNPVVRKPTQQTDDRKAEQEREQRAAQRAHDQLVKNIQRAASSLRNSEASSTEINLPGDSSESFANYGSIVVSVYHQHWIAPDNMTSESAVVNFTVTIARDGSVISSRISSPSGEPNVDRAVQRMLDRVTFIHEFPDDAKEQERTYHIDFNATRTNLQ